MVVMIATAEQAYPDRDLVDKIERLLFQTTTRIGINVGLKLLGHKH